MENHSCANCERDDHGIITLMTFHAKGSLVLNFFEVLILAMAISYGIKAYIEGAVITVVILLNIIVGFLQEYSAGKTLDSLRSLSSPTAHVVRDGDTKVIPTAEVVIGDLVELKTGDTVPADIR